jgi:hypothetical protein
LPDRHPFRETFHGSPPALVGESSNLFHSAFTDLVVSDFRSGFKNLVMADRVFPGTHLRRSSTLCANGSDATAKRNIKAITVTRPQAHHCRRQSAGSFGEPRPRSWKIRAAAAVHSSMRANPAVVNGAPRSLTKINDDAGPCRCSLPSAHLSPGQGMGAWGVSVE